MSVQKVRRWSDQPTVLEQGVSLATVRLLNVSTQVTCVDNTYYVTAGNLFGSETIKVKDANDALRALDALGRIQGEVRQVPIDKFGWELMPNAAE